VLDRRRIVECEHTGFDCGYSAALRIVKKAKPDAVIAINDVMALGARRAITQLGYGIPEEVSVAGFDDVVFSSIPEVPLTTVRQNVRQIGRQTVELLLKQVRGRPSAAAVHWVRPELIIRESTDVCLERSCHEAIRN